MTQFNIILFIVIILSVVEIIYSIEPKEKFLVSQNEEFKLNVVNGRIAGGKATCQCGTPIPRIVNGEAARINDIPWTVGIIRNEINFPIETSSPFCGGTLINDRYVVTAAHCVTGTSAQNIRVLLNEEDLLISTETIGNTRAAIVDKIIVHPNYNPATVNNDIALIKLSNPEPLGPNGVLIPVCLPANNNKDFSGLNGTVAGWGTTAQGGSTSSSLQKVDVPIISNLNCNFLTRYFGRITDGMLCAGFINTGTKDSCQGDSGGPLITDNEAKKLLVGVVSWGYGCAQKRAPGVYTRVGKYTPWILSNTKDGEFCAD